MGKLKRGNWSTYELERLRALYPKSTDEHVSRLLHRSVASVNRKAREIFGCDQTERSWTAGDDLRLREGYGVLTISVLCLVLGRPAHDVEARIDSFKGLVRAGKWTRTELGLLKRIYGSRFDEDLVVCFSRGLEDIRDTARSLHLSKDKGFLARSDVRSQSMPRWGENEIALLRDGYSRVTNLVLARQLGRSVASVANKANQLGLKKDSDVLREMGRRNVATRYEQSDDDSTQHL